MKIALLILISFALAGCQAEPERATHVSFQESGLSGSHCDGPCETLVIDSCRISGPNRHYVIAKMPLATSEVPPTPNSCDPTPPTPKYSSGFRKVSVLVEEPLLGKFKRGEQVEVLFLGRWTSGLRWEKDDHLLLVLRENQGEWFAYPSFNVELYSNDVQEGDGNQAAYGDVVFDFPSKISDLRAQLIDVNQNFAQRCDHTPQSDTEFEVGVRYDHNCDSTPLEDNNFNSDPSTNNQDDDELNP